MTAQSHFRLGVVIVAAGSGERFGNQDKVLAGLAGKPLLSHSIEVFASNPEVREIVVVAGNHTFERVRDLAESTWNRDIRVCIGGEARRDSVRLGLSALPADIDLVAVHDAARPLVRPELVSRAIAAAAQYGAAIPVLSVDNTLYRVASDGSAAAVEDRTRLKSAQTPQVARRDWLESALWHGGPYTDEGSALLAHGYTVRTVEGCPENIKITWPVDLLVAEARLARHEQ